MTLCCAFVQPSFAQSVGSIQNQPVQAIQEKYITTDITASFLRSPAQETGVAHEVEKINSRVISDSEASFRNLLGFGWGSFSQGDQVGGSVLFVADLINVTLLSFLGYSLIDAGSNSYFVAFIVIPVTLGFLLISRVVGGIMPYFTEASQ